MVTLGSAAPKAEPPSAAGSGNARGKLVLHPGRGLAARAAAQRPGVPWDLCVRVAGASAYYGDVRFCRSGGRGSPLPQNDLVVRIHRRWHEGQGPHSALENAIEIIRAYLGGGARRRAA